MQVAVETNQQSGKVFDVFAPREWVAAKAYFLWLDRGKPHGDSWRDWFSAVRHLQRLHAKVQGENDTWLNEHKRDFLERNPEWDGKHIAFAARADLPILAVADDWRSALDKGLHSENLMHAAQRENLPPSILITVGQAGSQLTESKPNRLAGFKKERDVAAVK